MKALLQKLWFLFEPPARARLLLLMLAMMATAILEVLGVASIMPFIMVLKNPDMLQSYPQLLSVIGWLGMDRVFSLPTSIGLLTLVLLVGTNMAALCTNRLSLKFSYSQSHTIATRLLTTYLRQPYEFFMGRNASELSKNILSEVVRTTTAVVLPLLQLAARLVVTLCIIGLLIYIDPWLALSCAGVLGAAYGAIFMYIRWRLSSQGTALTGADALRFQSVGEALAGIKDIQLSGRQAFFLQRFVGASRHAADIYIRAESFAVLPRYVLEMVAFGGFILVTLYLLNNTTNTDTLFPLLALYAFAGYRLMPAMQQIYYSCVKIRHNAPAMDKIIVELQLPQRTAHPSGEPIRLRETCVFDNICYTYPNAPRPTLNGLSLSIQAKCTVGLVGRSGAGKTTLVDVLLGLLPLTSGRFLVDGVSLTVADLPRWQAGIGYVPQQIYLFDDTITANIAFGLSSESVDPARVEMAARRAHLHDFILSLPAGYDTCVGDRGIKLSGGQRQRIGIARALYHEPSLLVMDEATNALDSITENAVMDAIHELQGRMTLVIVAHRLSTLQSCDIIYVLEAGRISDSGTYAQLLQRSETFRRLANQDQLYAQ